MKTEEKLTAEIGYNHLDLVVLIGLPYLYYYCFKNFDYNEILNELNLLPYFQITIVHLIFILCLLVRFEIWKTRRTWTNKKTKQIEIPFQLITKWNSKSSNLELETTKGKFQFPWMHFISAPDKMLENLKVHTPEIPFKEKPTLYDYYARVISILILALPLHDLITSELLSRYF